MKTRACNDDDKGLCGPPLPLVVINDLNGSTSDKTGRAKSTVSSNDVVNSESKNEIEEIALAPLEPAFLNRNDYPPMWLVYHPVLGVCPLEEADQYDKEIDICDSDPDDDDLQQPFVCDSSESSSSSSWSFYYDPWHFLSSDTDDSSDADYVDDGDAQNRRKGKTVAISSEEKIVFAVEI